jgi:hypothetical protein
LRRTRRPSSSSPRSSPITALPTTIGGIRREHVESFITDLRERKAPAIAHNRFRGCQASFNWLAEAGEVKTSRLRPTRVAVRLTWGLGSPRL